METTGNTKTLCVEGNGEMAQAVKPLLFKHEDLSSILRSPGGKKRGTHGRLLIVLAVRR